MAAYDNSETNENMAATGVIMKTAYNHLDDNMWHGSVMFIYRHISLCDSMRGIFAA
jgi:hypothetical protein